VLWLEEPSAHSITCRLLQGDLVLFLLISAASCCDKKKLFTSRHEAFHVSNLKANVCRSYPDAQPSSQGSGLAVLFTSCAQSGKSLMYGIRKRCLEGQKLVIIWVSVRRHKKIPPITAPITTRTHGATFQICKAANRIRPSAKLFAESIALVQIG